MSNEIISLEDIIKEIDPINTEYIMQDSLILRQYDSYCRWKNREEFCRSLAVDRVGENGKVDEECDRVAAHALEGLKEEISKWDSRHLTPANVKVGDGATVNYYTDREAGTIVKVTKCSITIQRDKAIRDPNFKPEFILGGFAAHCTNQDEQSYTYERNENGALTTIWWSKKFNRYGTPGNLTASKGRHEFYDYNF